MDTIKLEILELSYLEHFKLAKDMSLYLPLNDVRRQIIEKECNSIINKINTLKMS